MISEGYGFVGEVWRIKLNYKDRTSSTPESVAAKFANRDRRIKSFTTGHTVKEANVYRHLGPDSEFIMPIATFPLETTTVSLTVTDPGGLSDTDTVEITVEDTTPPTLTVAADPSSLRPPNHKYKLITLSIVASDVCDSSPVITAVAQSNESDNSTGDGNTTGDIKVTTGAGAVLLSSNGAPEVAFDPVSDQLELRAERRGNGQGRTYTVTVTATDASGNQTTATATVAVPHDRGKGKKK